jgi:hypothetical protein
MSCSDWEERIALYAGGDLSSAEVERHLRECAGCQLLLSGIRENLGLLREAHGEAIDAAHYAAVRARVLSELQCGRSRGWRHAWVYAMVIAAVLLVAVLKNRGQTGRFPVSAGPVESENVPSVPGLMPGLMPAAPARRRKVRREPIVQVVAEPIVVKLITDDPDVIIYWITDTKGE